MNLLTNRLTELYSNLATPHCVVGVCSPVNLAHNRAQSGFFVRTVQQHRFDGLFRETFGSASSKYWPANPVQPITSCFAASGDGFIALTWSFTMISQSNTAQNPSAISVASHIAVIDGKPTTTTQDIAQAFNKTHRDVLRIVRQRIEEAGEWGMRNFTHTPYVDPQNGQTYEVIRMTKKGFAFVVQKFTGKAAVQVQLAYVDEFERMEEALHNPLALSNGQHYVVAKDGVVVYHKVLTERTAQKYLPQHSSTDCERALKLVSELQAVNQLSGTVDYWQVRAALQQLTTHLHQHQPSSQMKPTIVVLEAVERMMMRLWTMADESHFHAGIIQHCTKDSKTLTDNNVQTIKNILGILSRENMRVWGGV